MTRLLFLCFFLYPAASFSSSYAGALSSRTFGLQQQNQHQQHQQQQQQPLFYAPSADSFVAINNIRGGSTEDTVEAVETEATETETKEEESLSETPEAVVEETTEDSTNDVMPISDSTDGGESKKISPLSSALAPFVSTFTSLGKVYGNALQTRPIVTKSVTACFIFALSDYMAQSLDNNPKDDNQKKPTNWIRTLSSAMVGLLYFGPAAHYWYEMIFKILPGTSLISTMQKAALGQLIFGPSFTCIFFATSLLQAGAFTPGNWFRKIREDLPTAWAAGLGFWPLVDLISYSMIKPQWIPLFVNTCSFVWTIYLSWISNRDKEE